MRYLIIFIFFIALYCEAGYPEKVLYWYNNNVSTNVPAINDIVELRDDSDGQGTKLNWYIANPPTKAVIDAIDNTTAVNWNNQRLLDTEADKDTDIRIIKALVKVINTRLPAGQKITAQELKAAYKTIGD